MLKEKGKLLTLTIIYPPLKKIRKVIPGSFLMRKKIAEKQEFSGILSLSSGIMEMLDISCFEAY